MKKKKRGTSRYYILFFLLCALIIAIFSTAKVALSKIAFFEIKKIDVKGAKNLDNIYLINLCKDLIGINLFTITHAQVIAKYDNIIRINRVSIHKKFPHTLQVIIEERVGVFYVKTKEGVLFPIDKERIVLDNEVFYEKEAALPIISTNVKVDSLFYGESVNDVLVEKVFSISAKLKDLNENFLANISEFYLSNDDLYLVEADTGYRIIFSEDNLADQLTRYNFIEGNRKFSRNNVVDLRFANQLIIRTEGK
jgi:cell division septal protein FtsQ